MAINLTTVDKTLRNLILEDEGGWGKIMTFWFSRPGQEAFRNQGHTLMWSGEVVRPKQDSQRAKKLSQAPRRAGLGGTWQLCLDVRRRQVRQCRGWVLGRGSRSWRQGVPTSGTQNRVLSFREWRETQAHCRVQSKVRQKPGGQSGESSPFQLDLSEFQSHSTT